jgi:hypothetical protein
MYGSLQQDVVWFDLRMFGGYLKYPQSWPRQFKYRSWVLRSEDGGLTWHYHGTIAALPELGDEVSSPRFIGHRFGGHPAASAYWIWRFS